MKNFVVVTAAVTIGLAVTGGTGYAVGTRIDGKHIKNGSISIDKLSKSARASLRGQTGRRGLQGVRGVPGPQGVKGDPGIQGTPGSAGRDGSFDPSKVTYVTGSSVTIADGQTGLAAADCPSTAVATGGGYSASLAIASQSQSLFGNSWEVTFRNTSGGPVTVYALAVCAGG